MAERDELAHLVGTAETPELGAGPRPGVEPLDSLNGLVDECFQRTEYPVQKQQLIRALVFLWHDHLDAAHEISQGIDNPDGAFVHGIVHRREPDYSNARYWFHRVGKHPAFPEIASQAGALLGAQADLRAKLIQRGEWDPFSFIDSCEQASRPSGPEEQRRLLRKIQGAESLALLQFWGPL
jgi:hypothetical protein